MKTKHPFIQKERNYHLIGSIVHSLSCGNNNDSLIEEILRFNPDPNLILGLISHHYLEKYFHDQNINLFVDYLLEKKEEITAQNLACAMFSSHHFKNIEFINIFIKLLRKRFNEFEELQFSDTVQEQICTIVTCHQIVLKNKLNFFLKYSASIAPELCKILSHIYELQKKKVTY